MSNTNHHFLEWAGKHKHLDGISLQEAYEAGAQAQGEFYIPEGEMLAKVEIVGAVCHIELRGSPGEIMAKFAEVFGAL